MCSARRSACQGGSRAGSTKGSTAAADGAARPTTAALARPSGSAASTRPRMQARAHRMGFREETPTRESSYACHEGIGRKPGDRASYPHRLLALTNPLQTPAGFSRGLPRRVDTIRLPTTCPESEIPHEGRASEQTRNQRSWCCVPCRLIHRRMGQPGAHSRPPGVPPPRSVGVPCCDESRNTDTQQVRSSQAPTLPGPYRSPLRFRAQAAGKERRRDRRRLHGCHRRHRCGGHRRLARADVHRSARRPTATPEASRPAKATTGHCVARQCSRLRANS